MLNKLRSKTKFKSRTAGRFLAAAHAGNHEKLLELITKGIDVNLTNEIGVTALHLSAKEGHVKVVNELLKHGARVDAATQKGVTALHVASLSGKVDVIKLLLDSNAKLNIQSKDGFTPLYMAAQENHLEAVKFLLLSGASQSLTTEDGFTALSVALQQSHDDIANVLLGHGTSSKLKLPQIHIATKKNDARAVSLLLRRNIDNVNVTSKSGFTPLHIAAHYGNLDIGRLLIEKGAAVNCQAKNGICPLHVACKRGRSRMVSLLTENAADVNCPTKEGMTPIHVASANGGSKIIENLLEKGASVNTKTRSGFSALHLATWGDHVNSAKQLLLHGANIDEISLDHLTPLHITAHYGNVRSARLLVENKCDVNPKAMNGFSPLHIAAKRNHKEIVDLLVKFGAMVEAQTETGITPLHVASFMGHSSIVQALLRLGTNPDSVTSSGDTPLHLATRNKHLEAMDLLLHSRAQVDPRTMDHITPLHISIDSSNLDGAALLLHHGASPNAKTTDSNTPLHLAAASAGKNELVQLLLEHGANSNSANKRGFLPLHVAAKHGNVRGAQMLLSRSGTEINSNCDSDLTPLHVAVHYNQINSVLLLLKKGADTNAKAKNGCSPLHIAANENRMNLVPHLLEHGADVNAETEAGFTPLHFSIKAGHVAMTSLLLERGASFDHASKDGITPLHLAAVGNRVPAAEALLQFGAEVNSETKSGLRPINLASQLGHSQMVELLLARNANGTLLPDFNTVSAEELSDDSAINLVGTNQDHLDQNSESSEIPSTEGQQEVSEEESNINSLSGEAVQEIVVSHPALNYPDEMSELFAFDALSDVCNYKRQSQPSPCSRIRKEFVYTRREDKESTEQVPQEKKPPPSEDLPSVEPSVEQTLTQHHEGDPPCLFDGSSRSSSAGLASNFLISFLVDARGGTMQGCRDSGIRVVVPPDAACQPTRITCRYVRKEKLLRNPPLNDGEGLVTRVLEMGPEGITFLESVLIEVSHFASLKDGEREVIVLRSDSGQKWCEHTSPSIDDETFKSVFGQRGESNQKVCIVTKSFPRYFALVSRFRHEVMSVGPDGGVMASKVNPKVQAIFPAGSIKRSTKIHLQVHPLDDDIVERTCGSEVMGVSPVVSIEPRHRRFHQPIAVTIPIPKSMIGERKAEGSYLRVLASRSEGTMPAVWEDITDGIALTILNGCATLLVTVSARFWLIDFSSKDFLMTRVTELYRETLAVPFWSKFVVFAKRLDETEARIRLFSIIDDQLEKTLENQEGFVEVVRSDEVEVCDGKSIHVELSGNLVPLMNPSQDLSTFKINFHAFRENRLPFAVKVKGEPFENVTGDLRVSYRMKSELSGDAGESPAAICIMTARIPDYVDVVRPSFEANLSQAVSTADTQISRAELRLTDIADVLDADWLPLAAQLGLSAAEINEIRSDYDFPPEQALIMLHQWVIKNSEKATGNNLERALKQIGRADVIAACMLNISDVTDDDERLAAKSFMSNAESRDELVSTSFNGVLSSRDSSMRRRASSDISYGDLSSLPGSQSFGCDTSSEVSSFAGKDEYSKSLFDNHLDDHCYYVDGSINSAAYARMRSIESEESDAILSDEASDIETGGLDYSKETWPHPQWKEVVIRRSKDEARVMADASVRLSQVSDITMTPDDGDEMERASTPCVQETKAAGLDKERYDYPGRLQDHSEKELLINNRTTARGETSSQNDEVEKILTENPHQPFAEMNFDSSNIVIDVEEGNIYLSTDVNEMEEILDDKTRVKQRIITRKQIRPVEEKFRRGDVILETRISEKVVHVEIDEYITELEPGVIDGNGANLTCNSATEEFEDMLPDGTLVQKRITKVHIGPKHNLDSVADLETDIALEPSDEVNAYVSKDIQSQDLEQYMPSNEFVPFPDGSTTTTEKNLEVIERMEGDIVQDVKEYTDERVSERGVKINERVTTIRHLLPVTEKIKIGTWGHKVLKKLELVGTEIVEEVTEVPNETDNNLEFEAETSVEESEETLPDGAWLRKRTTHTTMSPKLPVSLLPLNAQLDARLPVELKNEHSPNLELRKRTKIHQDLSEIFENTFQPLISANLVGPDNEFLETSGQQFSSDQIVMNEHNQATAGQDQPILKQTMPGQDQILLQRDQVASIHDYTSAEYNETVHEHDQTAVVYDQTAITYEQMAPDNDLAMVTDGQVTIEDNQATKILDQDVTLEDSVNLNQEVSPNKVEKTEPSHIVSDNQLLNAVDPKMLLVSNQCELLNVATFEEENDRKELFSENVVCKENNENENLDKEAVGNFSEKFHLKGEIRKQEIETEYVDDADKKHKNAGPVKSVLATEITDHISQTDQTTADHFVETSESTSPHSPANKTDENTLLNGNSCNQSQVCEDLGSDGLNTSVPVSGSTEEDLRKDFCGYESQRDKMDSMVTCSSDAFKRDSDEPVTFAVEESQKKETEQKSFFKVIGENKTGQYTNLDSNKSVENDNSIISAFDGNDVGIFSNVSFAPEEMHIFKLQELSNSESIDSTGLNSEQILILPKVYTQDNASSEEMALRESQRSLELNNFVRMDLTPVLETFSHSQDEEAKIYSTDNGVLSVHTTNKGFTENLNGKDKLTSENLTENRNENSLLNHLGLPNITAEYTIPSSQHSSDETSAISEKIINSKTVTMFNDGCFSQLGLLPQEPQAYQSHDDKVGQMTAITESHDIRCSQACDPEDMTLSQFSSETHSPAERNPKSISENLQAPYSGFGIQDASNSISTSHGTTFNINASVTNAAEAQGFSTGGVLCDEKSCDIGITKPSVTGTEITFLQEGVSAICSSELPLIMKQEEHFQELDGFSENILQDHCSYLAQRHPSDESTMVIDGEKTDEVILEGAGNNNIEKQTLNETQIAKVSDSSNESAELLVLSQDNMLNGQHFLHALTSNASEIMDIPSSCYHNHSSFTESSPSIKPSDILERIDCVSNKTCSGNENPYKGYLLHEQPQGVPKEFSLDSYLSRGLSADGKPTQWVRADHDCKLPQSPSAVALSRTPTEYDIQSETTESIADDVKHDMTSLALDTDSCSLTPSHYIHKDIPGESSHNCSDNTSEESQKSMTTTPRSKRINYSRAERRLARGSQSQEATTENVLKPLLANTALEHGLDSTTASSSRDIYQTQILTKNVENTTSPAVMFQDILKSPFSQNRESDVITFKAEFDLTDKDVSSEAHSGNQHLQTLHSPIVRQSLPSSILDEDDSPYDSLCRTAWNTTNSYEPEFSTSTISARKGIHPRASPAKITSPTSTVGRDIPFRKRTRRSSRDSVPKDLSGTTPQTPSADNIFQFPRTESSSLSPFRRDFVLASERESQETLPKSSVITSEHEPLSPTDFSPIEGLSGSRRPSILQSTLEAHARFLDAVAKIDEIAPGLLLSPTLRSPDVTQETVKGKIQCSTSEPADRNVETDDRIIMKKSTVIHYSQPVTHNFYRDGILIETRNSEVILGKYVDDYVYDSPKDISSLSDLNGEMSTSVDVSEETLPDGTWLKHKTTRVIVGPAVVESTSAADARLSTQHLVSSFEKNQKFHPKSDFKSSELDNRYKQNLSKICNIPNSPSIYQTSPPSKDLPTILSEMQQRTNSASGTPSASLQAILKKLGLAKPAEEKHPDRVGSILQESGSESESVAPCIPRFGISTVETMDSSSSTDQNTVSGYSNKESITAENQSFNSPTVIETVRPTADLSGTEPASELTVEFACNEVVPKTIENTSKVFELPIGDKTLDVSMTFLDLDSEKSLDKSMDSEKTTDRISQLSNTNQPAHTDREKEEIDNIDMEVQFQKNVENLAQSSTNDADCEKESENQLQESHSLPLGQLSSTSSVQDLDDGSSVDHPEIGHGKVIAATKDYQEVQDTQNICACLAEETVNSKD